MRTHTILALLAATSACATTRGADSYDVILRGGRVYDGLGGPVQRVDLGIRGDRIAFLGDLSGANAELELDVSGMAVAPGFINMLSWATESLLVDGRSLADIRQGVTLEVFGEGWSMGPLNQAMKAQMVEEQGDLKYEVTWTTLDEYLRHLVTRGIACNVASFVGATTVRIHELGYDDRAPTPRELERMQALVRQAMRDGALGLGSSLIYAPAFYAETEELIALASVVGEYGGRYITHMRSEGNRLLEGVEEVVRIATEANCGAEIYHLKAAGEANWPKMDQVIARIEELRAGGLDLTADMYTYTAGATGLDAAMPPWVQEGGYQAWAARLQEPGVRERVIQEMRTDTDEWENLLLAAGSPENVLLVGFKSEALKPLTGKTLAAVAAARGTTVEETVIDLVIEDGSRVGTVYFLMSEENVAKQLALPWVSLCSDAGSPAPEGDFLLSNPHPRAYGNFARFLGVYVRDQGVVPLAEAIRKLTSLPATNLRIQGRGRLEVGAYADVVVFDPDTILDHATFAEPHQLSTGVSHVFVNGRSVLLDGEPTGASAGRVVRGPGWQPQ